MIDKLLKIAEDFENPANKEYFLYRISKLEESQKSAYLWIDPENMLSVFDHTLVKENLDDEFKKVEVDV